MGVSRNMHHGFAYPETIFAWITSLLPYMIDMLPRATQPCYELLLLRFRTRSLHVLRKAIESHCNTNYSSPTVPLILQILYLFRSDCTRQQLVAAQAHAVVLPWIERATGIDPSMSTHLLITAMFHDTEMACKAVQRTLLDFEFWLAKMLKGFWAYTESFLAPAPDHIVNGLNPYLTDGDAVVFGAMIRLRRYLYIRDSQGALGMHPPDKYIIADLQWAWSASTTLHDIGLLLNHALNLIEASKARIEQKTRANAEIENELLTKRSHSQWEQQNLDLRLATTFATLYSVRKYLHEGNCNGVDLREAPLIMVELERVLRRMLLGPGLDHPERPQEECELLFWIFFTGAWHGQKMRTLAIRRRRNNELSGEPTPALGPTSRSAPSVSSSSGPSTNISDFNLTVFFDAQISRLASHLSLTTWPTARALLKSRFVFSYEVARLHPKTWYEELVKQYSSSSSDSNKKNNEFSVSTSTSSVKSSRATETDTKRRGRNNKGAARL